MIRNVIKERERKRDTERERERERDTERDQGDLEMLCNIAIGVHSAFSNFKIKVLIVQRLCDCVSVDKGEKE